jgi:hypothetical protein
MTQPIFEVSGEWRLTTLPPQPSPWMVQGRAYAVVLRRRSGQTLPEAEVRDVDSGEILARYSWRRARDLFNGRCAERI